MIRRREGRKGRRKGGRKKGRREEGRRGRRGREGARKEKYMQVDKTFLEIKCLT